jgi:hypothetical protein
MFRQLFVDLLGDLEQSLCQLAFDQLLSVVVDGDRRAGLASDQFGRRLTLRTSPTTNRGASRSDPCHFVLGPML